MTAPSSEDRSAVDWEARFVADDAPWERRSVHPVVQDWIDAGHLSVGQSVLIPGCGRSAEPLALAQHGLNVTCSDIAPSATAYQAKVFEREGLSGAFLQTDGLSYRPDIPFDALYEQTFLCAIHPHHRLAYEAMAHAVIRPGGQLLALFMQKQERGGPPYGCDLSAMRALFDETRWHWPTGNPVTYPHPGLNDKAELGVVLIRR